METQRKMAQQKGNVRHKTGSREDGKSIREDVGKPRVNREEHKERTESRE